MLVYNLSSQQVVYRGRPIPPNGGYLDYPDLINIPTRDRRLEERKILAFGTKPLWWVIEEQKKGAEAPLKDLEKPPGPSIIIEHEVPMDTRFYTNAVPIYGTQSIVPPKMPVETVTVEQSKIEDTGFNPPDTQPSKGVFGKRHRR